jgi:ABC-type transport system involved in multi-copper enzyme maturation permease subunit
MLFTIAMLGFIAAGAGYVPAMIEAGSIDLVLSKPIRRWQLFFGKYIGGLLLISVALLASYIVIFVGVGLVTGVWHWPFFNALPMTIFSLALLNAIVGWVGLWTRSTSMAMVIGYIYYLVVDTAVGLLSDPAAAPFLNELKGVAELSEFVKLTFPSFKWLRESAEASIFSVWFFPWKHVVVGMIWLVVCLGTAFNRFRINDY